MIAEKILLNFSRSLQNENLADNTIRSYISTVEHFVSLYGSNPSSYDLFAYKGFLVSNYKPQTVDLRIQAINKFLTYVNSAELRLKTVKLQEKTFLENVISNADYLFLKRRLFAD